MPFNTVHGVLSGEILKWFAIPFSSDHVLSELSTMTRLPWVALHGMASSFIELDKAAVHVIKLVSISVIVILTIFEKNLRADFLSAL